MANHTYLGIKLIEIDTNHTYSMFMPWLCVDHMIQQRVWPMGFSYPDPLAIQTYWQNPDPLVKSRPTGKNTIISQFALFGNKSINYFLEFFLVVFFQMTDSFNFEI